MANLGSPLQYAARRFFEKSEGITLTEEYKLSVGLSYKKERRFDLGSDRPPVIVECKSYRLNKSLPVPRSPNFSSWTEAMYYFHLAPEVYRKIFFVAEDIQGGSVALRYVRGHRHLIPDGVEIWEFNERSQTAQRFKY
jgi:hypothetical protein